MSAAATLRLKAYFFVMYAGQGCVAGYLPMFYGSTLQLQSVQVGVLTAILPVMSFLLGPQWLYLADKYKNHRFLLALNAVATALIVLLFDLLHNLERQPDTLFGSRFLGTLAVVTVFSVFMVPLGPILDCIVLEELEKVKHTLGGQDAKSVYGQQRWAASLAYGMAGFIVGAVSNPAESMAPMFYGYSVITGLFFSVLLYLPQPQSAAHERHKSGGNSVKVPLLSSGDVEADAALILRSNTVGTPPGKDSKEPSFLQVVHQLSTATSTPAVGSMAIFWTVCFIQGLSMAVINNFWFIALVGDLHAPSIILSINSFARIALEIPGFYWSSAVCALVWRQVQHLFLTHKHSATGDPSDGILALRANMVVSMALQIVRLLLYVVMLQLSLTAWMDVAVELMHGVIYSMFWSSAVQIAAKAAPTHLQGAAQGIFGAMFSGFGATVGALFGGVVYGAGHASLLFMLTSACMAAGIVLYTADIKRSQR